MEARKSVISSKVHRWLTLSMLVLVIGDSHVDNLGSSGPDYFEYRSQRVNVEYYGIRGATFQTYTNNGNAELLSARPNISHR